MTATPRQTAILFDLDGTLTDPFEGITRSIAYALGRLGVTAPKPDQLRWCIGPPLRSAFELLLDSPGEADLDEAVRLYRERYATTGKFENLLIDGIPEVLERLRGEGHAMFVATSKLKTYAGDIIDHFGLRPYFDFVHGSELDGTNSGKADLVRHILSSERLDPRACVMVGDRSHDVVGAAASGMPTIGVRWGYGAEGELEAAGAACVVERPPDIPAATARLLRKSGS